MCESPFSRCCRVCLSSASALNPSVKTSWLFCPLLVSQVKQQNSPQTANKVKQRKGKEKPEGIQDMGLSYFRHLEARLCTSDSTGLQCMSQFFPPLAQGTCTPLLKEQGLCRLSGLFARLQKRNSLFLSLG